MCGTSSSCVKLCLWLTPVSMCLMIGTIGFCMFGTCLYGWYFARKVEDDFIPWTCNVTEIWEVRGDTPEMVAYNTYPLGFPEEDTFKLRNDGYLRREYFMTKSENYSLTNSFYICNLYGYDVITFTVEDTHTIVWNGEKMQTFFNMIVLTGLALGLCGLFSYLCFWMKDKHGEIMHRRVKKIFFWLLFATACFVTGLCGLMINLFPYNNVATVIGLPTLGISLFYPFYCMWATCSVAKEMGLRPTNENLEGEIHNAPNEPGNPGFSIAPAAESEEGTPGVGEVEGR